MRRSIGYGVVLKDVAFRMFPSSVVSPPGHHQWSVVKEAEFSALVAHSPNAPVAVFTEEKAAVFGDSDSDRPTPDFAIGRNKTSDEIFIFAPRFAGGVIERETDDFVTGAFLAVP